ncbi:MAG TPA: LemA family protein, partial [Patescibacteria group bacterium]|nr:LemA family protein [Patescibacteria group bacterium]
MNITLIIAIIVGIILLFLWFTYNGLVRAKVRIAEALSQIDVQLKRRTDLIPNLVETVKGYAKHEKTL